MSILRLPSYLLPWQSWLQTLVPESAQFLASTANMVRSLIDADLPIGAARLTEPLGVGGIAQRGDYARLLPSEWLLADEMPGEFLRRAAMHEHLFFAPHQEAHREEPEISAIFDTGPLQIGAPRLAHLAIWIALARRAEKHKAIWRWCSAQSLPETASANMSRPMSVNRDEHEVDSQSKESCAPFLELNGAHALNKLMHLRSSRVLTSDDWLEWAQKLHLSRACEIWWIGAAPLPKRFLSALPARVKQALRVFCIDEPIATERVLRLRRGAKSLNLVLPEPKLAAKLLRDPGAAIAVESNYHAPAKNSLLPAGQKMVVPGETFSLQQSPVFSSNGAAVVIATLQQKPLVFAIPKRLNVGVYAPRTPSKVMGELLAVELTGKRLARVSQWDDQLCFADFGEQKAALAQVSFPRAELQEAKLSANLKQWLSVFDSHDGFAYLLDADLRLHGIELRAYRGVNRATPGAKSWAICQRLLAIRRRMQCFSLAFNGPNGLQIAELSGLDLRVTKTFGFRAEAVFLFDVLEVMLCLESDVWTMHTKEMNHKMQIDPSAKVMGIVRNSGELHACVCSADRFLLVSLEGKKAEIPALGDIASASICPDGAHISWLTTTRELYVYSIAHQCVLMHAQGSS